MPHVRSAEGKKHAAAVKRETEWLEFLQAAVPTLCQRLHKAYSKAPEFRFIDVYTQTKQNGPTAYHCVKPNGEVFQVRRLVEDYRQPGYALDCNICMNGDGVRFLLPRHLLADHGLEFSMNDIQIWDGTTFRASLESPRKQNPLRAIVYNWIQDTIRGELCRRRCERIREELVAAVWHPKRLARRLEEGGWEAVEAFA